MSATKNQARGGVALLSAAVLALILANSPAAPTYFWLAHIESLRATAIFLFFLSIGIELRHEITHGTLRSGRAAIVPILAAIGGMATPVVIYSLVNLNQPTAVGWGVPMSTDVAFALGALAIIGRGLPGAIRSFVMTVAVVDDSLTILMIAIFFASSFHLLSLVSIGAVAIGLFLPNGEKYLPKLQNIVAFGALPAFAFLSAGVAIGSFMPSAFFSSSITIGVLLAMLIGKPLGVLGTTWLVTKSGLGKLNGSIKWSQLAPVGLLFGMCFTVALLMSELSFKSEYDHANANLAVFIGTALAASIAAFWLWVRRQNQEIEGAA